MRQTTQSRGLGPVKAIIFSGIAFAAIFALRPILTFATSLTAPSMSFTYHGRMLNEQGTDPLTDTVSITLGIHDPSGTCLLYEETQADLDLSATNGVFSVQVGSEPGNAKRTARDPHLDMRSVFSNTLAQAPSAICPAGFSPTLGDQRKLRVTIQVQGGAPVTLSPDQTLSSVPVSMIAESLQGKLPSEFLQVQGSATQAALERLLGGASSDASDLHHHDLQYQKLGQSITIGQGSYLTLSSRANQPTGLGPTDAGKTWFDSASRTVKFWDGNQAQDLGQASSITSKLDAALPFGQIFAGNGAGTAQPATLSGTPNQITVTPGTGSITLSTPQDIHTGASPTFAQLTVVGGVKVGNANTPCDVATQGAIRYNTASNTLEYCNSSRWKGVDQSEAVVFAPQVSKGELRSHFDQSAEVPLHAADSCTGSETFVDVMADQSGIGVCVENTPRPAKSFDDAKAECEGAGKKILERWQWQVTCAARATNLITFSTSSEEWVSSVTYAAGSGRFLAVGHVSPGGRCTYDFAYEPTSLPMGEKPFRCAH